MRRTACWLTMAAVIGVGGYFSRTLHAAGNADAAFVAFWNAPDQKAAEKTIGAIEASGVDFVAAVRTLKAGRSYAKEKTGLIRRASNVGGESLETLIEIPADYDPAKKWAVRVQLH